MWIFTKDGFFSIVQDAYCKKDEVMVRARCREDLSRFATRIYTEASVDTACRAIIELPGADYRYRLLTKRTHFAAYVHKMAESIDYPTVKDNIIPKSIEAVDRRKAMYLIWRVLCDFQKGAQRLTTRRRARAF